MLSYILISLSNIIETGENVTWLCGWVVCYFFTIDLYNAAREELNKEI